MLGVCVLSLQVRAEYDAIEREHKARVCTALATLNDDGDRTRYQARKLDSVARLRQDMLRVRETQGRSGGYGAADIARGYAQAMADFELPVEEHGGESRWHLRCRLVLCGLRGVLLRLSLFLLQ